MNKIILMIVGILQMLIPNFKNPNSVVGIKETKEAMIAVFAIAIFCFKYFRDGIQFSDFPTMFAAMINDEEFKKVVENGYEGSKLIPAEFKDIDAGEGIELAIVAVEQVPKFTELASEVKE